MIAYVSGKLTHKDPSFVVVEAGGIGYHIRITLHTYQALSDGEACKLHTFLHIKEDAHTLYGFCEPEEKNMFMHLISISGVGPSIAVMVLSSLSHHEVREAIVSENVALMQSIKGIGAKTAQRIILELKDKLKKDLPLSESGYVSGKSSGSVLRSEALSALTTLGIPRAMAEKNIDRLLREHGESIKLEELIKWALR